MRRRNRYELIGFALVVLGLALLLVYWPVGVGLLALAAVCLAGAVRGWRFPGEPPSPDPFEGLSRKARRYVEIDPEWSVDFLEPTVTHELSQPVAFSGQEAQPLLRASIPVANAGREPVGDLPGLAAELTFFRGDGRLVHERIEARWSNNRMPQVRQPLDPEVRRLRATGEPEPFDVVARADDESAAFVPTADAVRGGRRLRIDPSDYVVRVRIRNGADEPVAWYRLRVPLMKGLELTGPGRAPEWAPQEKPRPAPPGPRVVPRKRSGTPRP